LKSGKNSKAIDLGISQAFLNFLYSNFGDYEDFFENNKLNREKFIKSKSSEVQKFINLVTQTQLWEMFIADIEKLKKNSKESSFVLSKTKYQDLLQKTSEAIGIVQLITECSLCQTKTDDLITKKGVLVCHSCAKKHSKREKIKSIMGLGSIKKDKKKDEDQTKKKGRRTKEKGG